MLRIVSPQMAASAVIWYRNNQITGKLRDLQDHYLIILCWYSLAECHRERVALSLANKDSQYLVSEWLQPIANQITHDARLTIVDAKLMRIVPWAYVQYVIISFGVVDNWCCFGYLCTMFMYFLLYHNIVL